MYSNFKERYVDFPLHVNLRPFKGYEALKFQKKGELKVAHHFLLMLILLSIAEYVYTGFLVNNYNPHEFSLLRQISLPMMTVVLINISIWSVTTLMNGKGKFIEMYQVILYSSVPLIITKFIALCFSHLIVADEIVFYYLILNIGLLWTVFSFIIGMVVVQEYSLGKTIGTLVLSVVAGIIILFILILLFSLLQQLYGFIISILREINYMMGG
ncbi:MULTISPECIES: YIP1 family protein [Turicibacter]|jgi:NHL repeat containing protein|uniref:YIP1 family protein n=1 Tax=Turicibacter TaxID=191303 RepID=UPI0001FD88CD|nr:MULTISPECIES: YIP1 family protein [Turicibacter]EGC90891.1 conserved domain protein [Turicibacter sp. HGF1]MBP3905172.1 YIP1 family protein [Turicibacter sp.]MCU7198195.1 YIP1 family protein [Turicibacter sanguinis]MDB8458242.1 YIP1 family protein [Turicibacter sanguinis]MDB8555305.1 YIP1 family protein [Turicibacter sanguinis]